MADILLKYLTDLPSASNADKSDLMHINQSGNDRSITIEVLASAIFNIRYPVGKVEWFTNDTNPNAIWSGSAWARIPGAGRTIRLANSSGSDTLQQGGADEVTLNTANIPSHSHQIDLSTELHDFGTLNTGSNGSHTHVFRYKRNGMTPDSSTGPSSDVMKTSSGASQESRATDSSGSHSHSMPIPSHSHKVTGNTNSIGSGEKVVVTNAYVKLAAWYRVS